MPTRKELRGAAAGLAGRFVSRYNDVNGYWALGLLYKAAADAGESTFTLNILNGETSSYFKYAKNLSAEFHSMLLKQLNARGFEEFNVISAIVELEFDIQYGFLTCPAVGYRATTNIIQTRYQHTYLGSDELILITLLEEVPMER